MTVLLVFLGGTIGAPVRYLLDRAVQRRHESVFPWGTLTVNLVGCLVLGLLTGAARSLPADMVVFAGTGICGAFTTFSTFGYETTRMLEEGSLREAGLNASVSLFAGVLAAAAGYGIGVGL
jgi:CrcB protein